MTFNVKDYGALGNGVQNDTSYIQAAIAAAQAAGGGLVFFPPGSYNVESTVNFNTTTAAAPIELVGIPSHANGEGSTIIGNFAGYIFDQNDDQIVVVSGITGGPFDIGETVTGIPSGAVPPLVAQDGKALTFPGAGFGSFAPGDTIEGSDSGATATVVSKTQNLSCLVAIRNLAVINSHASVGGAVKLNNVHSPRVDRCLFAGYTGLECSSNSYHGTITSTKFSGPAGNPAGSIGYYGPSAVVGCDFLGWDVAYQHSGLGGGIFSSRFESNNTAIKTGTDFDGDQRPTGGWGAIGNYSEKCNVSMELFCVTGGLVAGNQMTGVVAVIGSGDRTCDYRISGAGTDIVLSGNSCSGNCSVASYNIAVSTCTGNITFINCSGTNDAGDVWDIAKADVIRTVYINCPSNTDQELMFAQLPATEIVGEQWVISDGALSGGGTAVAGSTVQGGASQKLIVAWNGSVWKCVAVLA